jgi:hypothetical protein
MELTTIDDYTFMFSENLFPPSISTEAKWKSIGQLIIMLDNTPLPQDSAVNA